MFFCEKCRYLFNVTKDVKSKQVGGKINVTLTEIFRKFTAKDPSDPITQEDISKIKANHLINDSRFESLNQKEQRRLRSIIKALDKTFFDEDSDDEEKVGSNVAYFICKSCKNYRPIEPQTLIYSKSYNSAAGSESLDYTYDVHDPTLPRTRAYICKNANCHTHKKPETKEAILTKNTMDQIVYVCTVCKTDWVFVA